MRAAQVIADLIDDFFSGRAPDLRLRSGAETFGDLHAHLDDALGLRHRQRLGVGIGDDEVDTRQPRGDHVVDGIAAGAADAEHRDARLQFPNVRDLEIDRHGCLFHTRACKRRMIAVPVRHRRLCETFLLAIRNSRVAIGRPCCM